MVLQNQAIIKIIQRTIIYILYLTPFGYLLSMISILSGERTPGVYVHLAEKDPVLAFIKPNPTLYERLKWFFSGMVLTGQAYYIIRNEIGDNWGGSYALVAAIFGLTSLISAIFPHIKWNKNMSRQFRLSLIWILFIVILIFITVYSDLSKYIKF